ncbi:MAG: LamG-like jellyroll fold domain-containing protein [Thermodesulfovibrionia bacterium]|nr:LamG-like jellyroll fold domain-containing protein [Thermodesulfovibrionia bacterium]
MNALRLNKRKSVLFILLTLMTGLSFLLTGCGNGPTGKVEEPNAGIFAIDFNETPPDTSPTATVKECEVTISWYNTYFGTSEAPVTCADLGKTTDPLACSVPTDKANEYCTDGSFPTYTGGSTRTAKVQECRVTSGFTKYTFYGSNTAPTTCADLGIVGPAETCAATDGSGDTPDEGNQICEDFTDAVEVGFAAMGQSLPSLADKEFTVEAWLKRQSDPLKGAIFSRVSDWNGISLYVDANKPAFGMRKCISPSARPVYIVQSSTALADNEWHHVAATLVAEDHTSLHDACATTYNAKTTSIAVDTNDKIHIVFVDELTKDLMYATNAGVAGSSFIVQTIYLDADIGTYISLALDSNNKAHVSFQNITVPTAGGTDFNLMYATNADGAWTATTIDILGNSGEYNSIAVDSSDKVHISYKNTSNNDVYYATNKTGPWVTEQIEDLDFGHSENAKYISIALDSSGKVNMLYFGDMSGNGSAPRIRIASNATGSWVKNRISGTISGLANMSLAIDTSVSPNKFHVAYYNTNDLLYTTCSSADCTVTANWSVAATIDNGVTNIVGNYPSLVFKSGKLHVSYYDATLSDLKYSSCSASCTSGPSWTATTPVDAANDVGKFNDIAIDSSGKAHISYFDATTYALKYADNTLGSWATSVISTDGRKQIPHLDLYVDGEYEGCAATMENYSDSLTYQQTGSCIDKTDNTTGELKETIELIGSHSGWGVVTPEFPINGFTKLNAVVDDVRLWSTSRTVLEINTCMAQELSVTPGTCGIDNQILKGYWKFNGGSGLTVADHSGSGNSGSKYYCDYNCTFTDATSLDWFGGWTTDSPF